MVRKNSQRSFAPTVEYRHHWTVHCSGEAEVWIREGVSEERELLHNIEVYGGEGGFVVPAVGESIRQEDDTGFIWRKICLAFN